MNVSQLMPGVLVRSLVSFLSLRQNHGIQQINPSSPAGRAGSTHTPAKGKLKI
jgi:hypothetical protein